MKSWADAVVSPDASLKEALATLDREALRIVMVVDGERRLLGTVTDGDVRRALLRDVPLSAPVRLAMCSTPMAAQTDWTRERTLAFLQANQFLQLPVVDGEGRLVGLETLHDLLRRGFRENAVFLMAGGYGTRLHPFTRDTPKPLLRIGDKPILEMTLEALIGAGFHRFFISTHYLPDLIRAHFGDGSRWGVEIRYVHEETPLGTGGALGLLPHDEIDRPILMMNGDLLTTMNHQALLDFHGRQGGVATICVREYEHQVPYGVVQGASQRVEQLIEKPVQRLLINAGIYVLSPELVKMVGPGVRIDMPQLLQGAIASGKPVNMFSVTEPWLDIGRPEDYVRARAEFGGPSDQ